MAADQQPAPPIAVPERTSSKLAATKSAELMASISKRRLHHHQSRQDLHASQSALDLKRKRSDLKEFDRVVHELQAEELSVQKLELDKSELELEWDERRLRLDLNECTAEEHRAAIARISRLIDLVGDDIWEGRRKIRRTREDLSELDRITIDKGDVYTSLLLRLYVDPTKSSKNAGKRSGTVQSKMKDDAIDMYGARHPTTTMLYCAFTRKFHPKKQVVAAHIVPHRLGEDVLDYLMPGCGKRLNAWDNCLLMYEPLERSFDKGHFVLMPVDPNEEAPRRWKIAVVSDEARNTPILGEDDDDEKGGDDGKDDDDGAPKKKTVLRHWHNAEVNFKTRHRPAARFLYFHFVMTLLRLRHYERPGWQNALNLRNGKPWATLGRYMRRSMMMKLANRLGDVDEDIHRFILDSTYFAKQPLEDIEESEFVRQLKQIYDKRDDEADE